MGMKQQPLRPFTRACLIMLPLAFACACSSCRDAVVHRDGIVNGETGRRLDEYFTSIAAKDFSGVLLVVKDEQVILFPAVRR